MFDKMCYVEDKLFKMRGLYALWTCLFVSNFVCLLNDSTTGAVRDFNVLANGISVIYCGVACFNNIYGNQMPSTLLVTAGPVHQYAFWILFAYFGGGNVLSKSPVGVMNWISLFVVGVFSIDMVVKTWAVTLDPKKYLDYVARLKEGGSV